MTQHDFQNHLHQALAQNTLNADDARRQTQALTAAALRAQNVQQPIGFGVFLLAQLRFIGWQIWLTQALVLITLNALLNLRFGAHYVLYPSLATRLLCFCSVLVLATALPFLHNATLYRMQEVEAATRFSSLRLLAAKLVLIGIGDLLMLGGILMISLYLTPLSLGHCLLCLVLPFLLAASGSLTLLRRLRTSRFYLASGCWCALLCTASLFGGRWLVLTELTPLWLLVAVALCAICVRELYQLFCRSAFSELQLN